MRPMTLSAALVAAPLVLAACAVTARGPYTPRPAPPPRAPERVVVLPPHADLSGDWVLGGPGNARQGQARGREGGPPGQARERGRDEVPPGQARGRDQVPPGQARGREEGPPGQVRQEEAAFALGAAPRLRIRQDERSFTVMREGAVPLTLPYDGRPVYFSGPRGGTRGAVSGSWRGRGFEVRWEFYGERVVTETYQMTGNGDRLTVRTRVIQGDRPGDGSAPARYVYHRADDRRP